ncbi:hypothetical protein [Pectobacterium carotovorum]|uniref:hypothetical protein n=1 Tax=Pectobacterium carotovorum TaxID=554 RepID=UPI00057F1A89|nr:hypothetical protein [Pectobacterium carotovorum]KHT33685.1 hypothetical protein RD01_01965 [Pectobacterium carotovorum subsp. carotovorum]
MLEYTLLTAPKNLCIEDDLYSDQTLLFFEEIEKLVRRGGNIEISFHGCKEITSVAALILFSTVNYIQLKYGFTRIKIKPISIGNRLTYDLVLSQSGVWDAITCQDENDINNLVIRNNKFKTSCDPSIIKRVETILKNIKGLSKEHIFFLTLAMKEAILNVVQHAYIDKNGNVSPDEIGARWWQCAWVNTRDKVVNIIIRDRGVGILGSYKSDALDENIICQAMEQGFSRTGLANRGMGSEDIKRPINELKGEQVLTLYTGEYVYEYQLTTMQPTIKKRNVGICGTIVHWHCSYDS